MKMALIINLYGTLTEQESMAVSVLRRLALPSSDFYRTNYPNTFGRNDIGEDIGGFHVMIPLQYWYLRTGYEDGTFRHHIARAPHTNVVWTYEGDSKSTYYLLCSEMEANQRNIFDKFSRIIETEWNSRQIP